jgi:hypothetical protein
MRLCKTGLRKLLLFQILFHSLPSLLSISALFTPDWVSSGSFSGSLFSCNSGCPVSSYSSNESLNCSPSSPSQTASVKCSIFKALNFSGQLVFYAYLLSFLFYAFWLVFVICMCWKKPWHVCALVAAWAGTVVKLLALLFWAYSTDSVLQFCDQNSDFMSRPRLCGGAGMKVFFVDVLVGVIICIGFSVCVCKFRRKVKTRYRMRSIVIENTKESNVSLEMREMELKNEVENRYPTGKLPIRYSQQSDA